MISRAGVPGIFPIGSFQSENTPPMSSGNYEAAAMGIRVVHTKSH